MTPKRPSKHRPRATLAAMAAAALALTLVFCLYSQVGLVVDLAGRFWSCI